MKAPTPQLQQRFSDWQRNLTLTNKASQTASEVEERQRALVAAVNAGPTEFTEYLRAELGLSAPGQMDVPLLPRQLDPSELRDPPLQLEREICASFSGRVTPSEASQPLFWTRCHYEWIASGLLGDNLSSALLGTLSTAQRNRPLRPPHAISCEEWADCLMFAARSPP